MKQVWIVVTLRKEPHGQYVYSEGPFRTQAEARRYAKFARENELDLKGKFLYRVEKTHLADGDFK